MVSSQAVGSSPTVADLKPHIEIGLSARAPRAPPRGRLPPRAQCHSGLPFKARDARRSTDLRRFVRTKDIILLVEVRQLAGPRQKPILSGRSPPAGPSGVREYLARVRAHLCGRIQVYRGAVAPSPFFASMHILFAFAEVPVHQLLKFPLQRQEHSWGIYTASSGRATKRAGRAAQAMQHKKWYTINHTEKRNTSHSGRPPKHTLPSTHTHENQPTWARFRRSRHRAWARGGCGRRRRRACPQRRSRRRAPCRSSRPSHRARRSRKSSPCPRACVP